MNFILCRLDDGKIATAASGSHESSGQSKGEQEPRSAAPSSATDRPEGAGSITAAGGTHQEALCRAHASFESAGRLDH